MNHPLVGAWVGLAFGATACPAERTRSVGEGGSLAIGVAPLSLPGLVDACYGLVVENERREIVWSLEGVCAARFGDGTSDIAYVGPCDATDSDGDGFGRAWVTLTIEALYVSDGPDEDEAPDLLDDWRDPCAAPHAPGGCVRAATCVEGRDAPVDFDLTVMREARQGFFDLAVSFDDIFCSAKVDCAYPAAEGEPARPIELVLDPASGARVQTVVWAMACTDGDPGGPVATATHLYMDTVALVCDGITYPVSPSAGPGNVFPGGVGAPAPLVQAMVFEGRERIRSGGVDADKLFWSVALGLAPSFFSPALGAPADCVLETRATASRGPLPGGVTPADTNYPYIAVQVPINDGATIVCTQHPLDGVGAHAGVSTAYTGSRPDGSGFATTTFAHTGAPTATGMTTEGPSVPVGDCVDGADCAPTAATCQEQIAAGEVPACELSLGVCAGLTRPASLCRDDGAWEPCTAADYLTWHASYSPGGEVACDGLDNDCNGLTDEGCAASVQVSLVSGGSVGATHALSSGQTVAGRVADTSLAPLHWGLCAIGATP